MVKRKSVYLLLQGLRGNKVNGIHSVGPSFASALSLK